MFDSLSQWAEKTAITASRRQFLGELGRGAMLAAAAVAGILALPAISQGGRKGLLCGGGGWIDCNGKKTGDVCYIDGVAGICRYDRIDFTPPTACECYIGNRGPR